MNENIDNGRAVPPKLENLMSGPHCPVCDGKKWIRLEATPDVCATCGWKVGDLVPQPESLRADFVPDPMQSLAKDVWLAVVEMQKQKPTRVERIAIALMSSPNCAVQTARQIADVAIALTEHLDKYESEKSAK